MSDGSENWALYLNGVYESVLADIASVQAECPELVLYLQRYKNERIVRAVEDPPTIERPRPLYISTTDDLDLVRYAGRIVGWYDKREIPNDRWDGDGIAKKLKNDSIPTDRWAIVDEIIDTYQSTEPGLYKKSRGPKCVNLVHVRTLKRLGEPIPVTELVKLSDGEPYIPYPRSGGWSYVQPLDASRDPGLPAFGE
jgi:hypothetical protein